VKIERGGQCCSELLVPTLEGRSLKVPPGTTGRSAVSPARTRFAGVSGKRGDLFVEVQINLPKKLNERERELWNELAKQHGTYIVMSSEVETSPGEPKSNSTGPSAPLASLR